MTFRRHNGRGRPCTLTRRHLRTARSIRATGGGRSSSRPPRTPWTQRHRPRDSTHRPRPPLRAPPAHTAHPPPRPAHPTPPPPPATPPVKAKKTAPKGKKPAAADLA